MTYNMPKPYWMNTALAMNWMKSPLHGWENVKQMSTLISYWQLVSEVKRTIRHRPPTYGEHPAMKLRRMLKVMLTFRYAYWRYKLHCSSRNSCQTCSTSNVT